MRRLHPDLSSLKVTLNKTALDATCGQRGDELFRLYRAPPAVTRILTELELTPLPHYKMRKLVHRDGDWHRSVDVWIHDVENGTLLVQQRSALKDTNPNKFDVSCAGHMTEDASPVETAMRELEEELGYTALEGELVPCFIAPVEISGSTDCHGAFIDREIVTVFLLRMRLDGAHFSVGIGEVAGLHTQSASSVIDSLRRRAEDFVAKPKHYIDALATAVNIKS